ncbi:MAG: AgmX/PglI C-terminal domain-containing protein [Sandaracinaceae bacterium]|nr:AgmX/PglI C-terminal domain-containing protein [Sandaracinaceae bacterium]
MRHVALLISLAVGCGGAELELAATVATVRPVRGAASLGDEPLEGVSRIPEGTRLSLGERGLARLELDGGGRALLGDGAVLVAVDDSTFELTAGRAYVEADAGGVEVRAAGAVLRSRDAGVSIRVEGDVLRAYVVRGELGWTTANGRGITGAGRELVVDGSGARAEPATLWDDWTRGLAEPGPSEVLAPEGVGVIRARVPDEVGQARWPLVIRRLDVRVRVEGDLAITEVDEVFFNPASETVEGLYRLRVPAGAVLSRFAVDREGVLVDGHVRERGQALTAYTEQVYRGSTDDPALLEWDGPQAYSARIYPIRPGETRRIVVQYGEWMRRAGTRRTYRYPMGGAGDAARVQELSLVVDLEDAELDAVRAGLGARVEGRAVRLRRSDFVPRADFWLDLEGGPDPRPSQRAWRAPHEPPPRASATRPGTSEADERDYWYLPLVVPADPEGSGDADALDVVVVADISAGTDRARLELGRAAVESLVGSLGPADRVAVLGADLTVRPIDDDAALGPAEPARVERLLEGIARVGAGGATDLGAVLTAAADLLDPERAGVVVYVGDGAPTVGERTAAALRERLARAPVRPRLYALAVGADAGVELLEGITRGGGLTRVIEERRAAAEAALDVVAHARHPIARDVTVELGDGVANVYPREPVDAVVGDVLPIAGRLAGAPPTSAVVSGTIHGRPFRVAIPLAEATAPSTAGSDLRLRWAGARLGRLLAEGATREEVAELGVRYGAITPYTSYYVPSARELAAAATPAATTPTEPETAAEYEPADAVPQPVAAAPRPEPAPEPEYRTPARRAARALAEEPSAGSGGTVVERSLRGRWSAGAPQVQGGDAGAVARAVRSRGAAFRACYESRLRADPTLAGVMNVQFTVGGDGAVTSASVTSASLGDPVVTACVLAVVRSLRVPEAAGANVVYPFVFASDAGPGAPAFSLLIAQTLPLAIAALEERSRAGRHETSRCSDAAQIPLEERQALWRERLDREGWQAVQVAALRDCEARTWRERRALLSVVLAHAGGVAGMLAVYSLLDSPAARGHARAVILDRVRTSEDLRAVRAAFGDDGRVDWTLVEQILERAGTAERRARALRGLVEQYPRSFELRLRLLAELEGLGRTAEADRLVARLRADPSSDPGVRTAIGELLLRRGDEADARRAFSEIVELAPLDELARRRLGDLYRAHGWHADAYRQYETLAELRPDDASVLLLLAQAAAGAGRVDEALRLEARLAQTSEPGHARGIARTALLWSSVRFAALRHATEDAERLARIRRRMRRSGVLSQSVPLRVTLTFAHPDAHVALYVARPGEPLARAEDIDPEHGIEVFESREPDLGAIRLEVRREIDDATTAVDAELLVVWNEGGDEERIEVVPLRFEGEPQARAFTLEGRRLNACR